MTESNFRQRFTRIEGLSAIRRLPRLGKIRLGIKKKSTKTGEEYPSETDYFVVPAEVKTFYGDEPKELTIMFPLADPEVIFPQCYKWYGKSIGLKCRGDGLNALRLNEETGNMEERECPCDLLEQNKCKQRASLLFILPDVAIGGVYQIDLSSYHSIVDINSGIDYARALLDGKIAMMPFKLRRTPKETHNEGKKQIHYTLSLHLDMSQEEIMRVRNGEKLFLGQGKRYAIEPPTEMDKNPKYDSKADGAVIEEVDEPAGGKKKKEHIWDAVPKIAEEIQKDREREAKLKENEPKMKSKAEINNIALLNKGKLIAIEKIAKEKGYFTWGDIVLVCIQYGNRIFPLGTSGSQAKRIILDHKDKYEAVKQLLIENPKT